MPLAQKFYNEHFSSQSAKKNLDDSVLKTLEKKVSKQNI